MTTHRFDGDASALAQSIVAGRVSAREVLQQTVERVRRMNPALNAVCLLRPEVAEPRAAALDAELAMCRDEAARAALLKRRPFFGVPLLLKDVGPATACVELPSRAGSRLLGPEGQAWPVDGVLTQRYLAAGFVPFGRTTSPEMGISASTEAQAYGGPTRNPWNTAHSAGGSSGGAASATASGMVAIAHANDGAGSIRIPASACGLVGLKPSRGLMPVGPLAGEGWGGMAIDHMVTRSVRDCAASLQASAGSDAGAPYASPSIDGLMATLDEAPKGLRIGLCNRFFDGDPVHPEVAAVVDAFAKTLQRLGHHVEEADPGLATLEVVRPVMQVVATGTAMGLEAIAKARGHEIEPHEVEPVTWSALQVGRGFTATDYLRAVSSLHALGRRMARFHERYDLLLTPTLAEPPAVLGRFAMSHPDFIEYRLGPNGLWRYTPFTPLANATGAPSISLPAGRSSSGLPIGVMLGAALGQDALLLRVARQWEASLPQPLSFADAA